MTDFTGAASGPLLGDGWTPGPDGMLYRRGARVVILDPADRILLARGHDVDRPERSWWFTIGGGIQQGESDLQAAVREVREETGLCLDPAAVVGPVFRRRAVFDFYRATCRQDETIFLARLDRATMPLSEAGWTDVERGVLDELRWWTLEDLRGVEIEVFPAALADLVEPLLAGWDGITHELSETTK